MGYNDKGNIVILLMRYLCVLIFVILTFVLYHVHKSNDKSGVVLQTSSEELLNLSSSSDVKAVNSKYFARLLDEARQHPRKRRMTDLTKDPKTNSMQVLINTWTEGSYSPIHMHEEYSEVFTILQGALAFFTFTSDGIPTCHILSSEGEADKAIIVEKQQYHGMTAAPASLGYPGYAIVFENSGHSFSASKKTKVTAKWAPVLMREWGIDGDKDYFNDILQKCPRKS